MSLASFWYAAQWRPNPHDLHTMYRLVQLSFVSRRNCSPPSANRLKLARITNAQVYSRCVLRADQLVSMQVHVRIVPSSRPFVPIRRLRYMCTFHFCKLLSSGDRAAKQWRSLEPVTQFSALSLLQLCRTRYAWALAITYTGLANGNKDSIAAAHTI